MFGCIFSTQFVELLNLVMFFIKFGKIFTIIFQIFFHFSLFLSSSPGIPVTCQLETLIFPHRPLRLCSSKHLKIFVLQMRYFLFIFLQIHLFFFPGSQICCWGYLVNFSFVIVLFCFRISIWFCFMVSISLLNICICSLIISIIAFNSLNMFILAAFKSFVS